MRVWRGLLGPSLLACASACHAWGTLVLMDAPSEQDHWSAGGQVMSLPRAPGQARSDVSVLPALDYYGHSGLFVSTENGVGYNVVRDPQWAAGVRLWPQWGRARQDAQTLPEVGMRLQPQVFANWSWHEVLLLQSAVSTRNGQNLHGTQAEVGCTSGVPLGEDLLGIGLSATWGNRSYRRTYLGMDHAAWSDWSWTASVTHRFNPHWHLDAQWQWAHVIHADQSIAPFQSRQQGGLLALLWDW